ncbi:MAG: class I SAM-dependent methyltransferase [Candidatus Woesearchaeota archaeon]
MRTEQKKYKIFLDKKTGERKTFEEMKEGNTRTFAEEYTVDSDAVTKTPVNGIEVVDLLDDNGKDLIKLSANERNFELSVLVNALAGRSRKQLRDKIEQKVRSKQWDKRQLGIYLDVFSRLIRDQNITDEQDMSLVLSMIGMFRYEVENSFRNGKIGYYQGTFVLPEDVRYMLPDRGTYLEIGMGPGDNIITLAEEKKNVKFVLGSDISPSMVYRAMRKYKGNVSSGLYQRKQRRVSDSSSQQSAFFVADAQDLPLVDESIDVAIICNALDRIPTATTTMGRIGSLVRPGGYIVVAQCNPFQNEFVQDGFTFSYVPNGERLNSVDDAISASGLTQTFRRDNPCRWEIETLLYGKEQLYVDVAIGQK